MFYALFDSWLTGIGYFFGVLSTLATESYSSVLHYWSAFLEPNATSTTYFTAVNIWTGDVIPLTNLQPSNAVNTVVQVILDLISSTVTNFLSFFGNVLGINELPFVLGMAIVFVVLLISFRMIKWLGTLFNPLKGT